MTDGLLHFADRLISNYTSDFPILSKVANFKF